MIAFESYDFICKRCDEPYRGLVKRCPHCGAEIRPIKKWTESKETEKSATYVYKTKPEDLLTEIYFDGFDEFGLE